MTGNLREIFDEYIMSIGLPYSVATFEATGEEQFTAELNVNLINFGGTSLSSKCDTFVEKFSEVSKTNWIVRKTYPELKSLYKKLYVCHHSDFNKKALAAASSNKFRERNQNCKASMCIKIMKHPQDFP
ncbi:hypothetical protein X975_19855, partial [Stegodyphus mimosarum]